MTIDNGIEIELDGYGKRVLRPSLAAAKAVNRIAGNYLQTQNLLVGGNIEAHIAVAKAGLTNDRDISTKDLEEAIYRTGLNSTVGPLTDFVRILQNGGRPPKDESGGEQRQDEGQEGNS